MPTATILIKKLLITLVVLVVQVDFKLLMMFVSLGAWGCVCFILC